VDATKDVELGALVRMEEEEEEEEEEDDAEPCVLA
jgi:hypothetical protein